MNTHDIEPLQDAADLLRSYLKLCKSLPRGDSYHLGRIERAIAAIEADRQARGEPVAWIVDHIAADPQVVFKQPQIPECHLAAAEVKITPLYAVPQPTQEKL